MSGSLKWGTHVEPYHRAFRQLTNGEAKCVEFLAPLRSDGIH
jgi:hypothetical protein